MTVDLVERLRAALDRAEQKARAATPGPWEAENEYRMLPGCRCLSCHEDEPYGMAIHDIDAVGEDSSPILKAEDALHIASWDPNTVLRLVSFFRYLAEEHRGYEDNLNDRPPSVRCFADDESWPCEEIRRAAKFWLGAEVTDADH